MIVSTLVVLLNGTLVASAPPAELVAWHVMVPLPVVTRFAERVVVDAGGTIVIDGRGHRCSLRLGATDAECDTRPLQLGLAPFVHDGISYIPLGDVARAFGGDISFDAESATVDVWFAPDRRVHSPAPFDPSAPQVAPTAVFTPEPVRASPQPAATGSPRPRRTAIPVSS